MSDGDQKKEISFLQRLADCLPFGISLGSRIYLSTILILVTTSASYLLLYRSQERQAKITNQILNERLTMLETARELSDAVLSYDNRILRFVATKSEEGLANSQDLKKIILSKIDELENVNKEEDLKNRLVRLRANLHQYFNGGSGLVELARTNALPSQAGLFEAAQWARNQQEKGEELTTLSSSGSNQIKEILVLCDNIVSYNSFSMETAKQQLAELRRKSHRSAQVVLYIAFGLVFVISMFLAITLVSPLRILMDGVRQMEEGEMEVDLPITTSTEFGQLMDAFNRMARTIQIQRERLVHDAITDSLTGAYNQGYLNRRLKEEFDRSKRHDEPLSLMMIDVDHFKEYNDTYGHEQGNEILKTVTDVIRDHVRSSDILFRYGGDEFAIILPGADSIAAHQIASRLVEAINRTFCAEDQASSKKHPTLSIGGATFPHHALTIEALRAKADEMLYVSKSKGRNCFYWCDTLAAA